MRGRTAPLDRVPPLPYRYDDLEPHIDTHTMQLHYDGRALTPPCHPCGVCLTLRLRFKTFSALAELVAEQLRLNALQEISDLLEESPS